MVLTEAFAAGTPVVASDIAGYRDVVADGVRRAAGPARGRHARWPRRCATWPTTRRGSTRLAANAARGAERYAWPRVAEQVVDGLRGRARGAAARERGRACRGQGRRAARGRPAARSRAAPAVAGARARRRAPRARRAPRSLLGGAALATAVGSFLAVQHIGLGRIGDALVRSSPAWVLLRAGADVRARCCCAPSPGTRS